MFNFLKKKLKGVVDNFSKKAEEELEVKDYTQEKPHEPVKEEPKVEKPEETTVPETFTEQVKESSKKEVSLDEEPKEELVIKDKKIETPAEESKPEEPVEKSSFKASLEEVRADLKRKAEEIRGEEKKPKNVVQKVSSIFRRKEAPKDEKKGIISKLTGIITTTKISEGKFDDLFEEMEILLLENNVALEVIDKIKEDLKASIVDKPINRGQVAKIVSASLKGSIESLFDVENIDFMEKIREKKPFIIMFAGINGSGKTTTIAKIASKLQQDRLKVVMAAADTFRAAAIQQLQEHADKLGVKLIKHDYGSDPAAVAFDAVKYAEAKGIDVVLIDTAGRQHSNANLMEEMKKVVRVAKPDLKIFVGESITGNDCVEQAKQFNAAIGIDGIVLSKADVDEKGGAAISVSYVTKKPIIYLGTGQEYNDLTSFKPDLVVESLGLA